MDPSKGDSRNISDVVFYYKLNDGGPVASDDSGNTNVATIYDGSSTFTPGANLP